MNTPLADQLRPRTLDEVVGQEHLVGKKGLLTKLLAANKLPSMIFWGPPGTGKTTLARILADSTNSHFEEISAVTANLKDVRAVIERAKALKGLSQTGSTVAELKQKDHFILFVDEIHRFSKSQQDAFLPHVENGTIILIGATTENPSFEVINALLSRSQVITLNPLDEKALNQITDKSLEKLKRTLDKQAREHLLKQSNGDARKLINTLETAASLSKKSINKSVIEQALQHNAVSYDKKGDFHYDTISAFIKSMRGSDVDAALFYLHRMLASGEDPKFIARRMVIFASEDIGMAAPYALSLAIAGFDAVERVGLPEAEYNLSHVVAALALSPKSRKVTNAMYLAKKAVKEHPGALVPLHVRNSPTQLMKDLGYGKGYHWEADFKPKQGFLPTELSKESFYEADNE